MADTLVILDMDGVLLDLSIDTEAVRDRIRAVFEDRGIHADFRPLLATLNRELETLGGSSPTDATELRQRAWQIIDRAEMDAAQRAVARPGAHALLHRLRELPLALYTNNSVECAEEALARAGMSRDLFGKIYGRTGADSLKPSHGPIAEAVASLGDESLRRVVMVGDHPYDMQSLRSFAGHLTDLGLEPTLRCVAMGVLKESDLNPALEDAGADYVVTSLEDAGDLILTNRAECSLSLVILAYNEEKLIARAIEDARRFCRDYVRDYEIVVVDDGSVDDTPGVVATVKGDDLKVVTHPRNQGMGASMKHGYEAATMDYVAHLPGDRQVRPQHLIGFLPHIQADTVVLSTYGSLPSGSVRGMISKIFRILVKYGGGLTVNFAGTYVFARARYAQAAPPDSIASKTFLFSFQLLEGFNRLGARFCSVTIEPFSREVGQSREATVIRMVNMMGEIARHRLGSLYLLARGKGT